MSWRIYTTGLRHLGNTICNPAFNSLARWMRILKESSISEISFSLMKENWYSALDLQHLNTWCGLSWGNETETVNDLFRVWMGHPVFQGTVNPHRQRLRHNLTAGDGPTSRFGCRCLQPKKTHTVAANRVRCTMSCTLNSTPRWGAVRLKAISSLSEAQNATWWGFKS